MRIKMNRKTKRILSIVLGFVLLFGAIALVVNLVKPKNDELKEIHPTFEVGGLDENGDFVDTKESLYTKKAIEYNELKVAIDFDANIQYQLFYYDEDDKFVSTSEVFTKGHTEESEETKYVRVLITPVYDKDATEEDKEIKWHEVFGYANQLTISTKVNAPAEVLSFTITDPDGKEYNIVYEDGMTWGDWYNSSYCLEEFSDDENGNLSVHGTTDFYIIDSTKSDYVNLNDLIHENVDFEI